MAVSANARAGALGSLLTALTSIVMISKWPPEYAKPTLPFSPRRHRESRSGC